MFISPTFKSGKKCSQGCCVKVLRLYKKGPIKGCTKDAFMCCLKSFLIEDILSLRKKIDLAEKKGSKNPQEEWVIIFSMKKSPRTSLNLPVLKIVYEDVHGMKYPNLPIWNVIPIYDRGLKYLLISWIYWKYFRYFENLTNIQARKVFLLPVSATISPTYQDY